MVRESVKFSVLEITNSFYTKTLTNNKLGLKIHLWYQILCKSGETRKFALWGEKVSNLMFWRLLTLFTQKHSQTTN